MFEEWRVVNRLPDPLNTAWDLAINIAQMYVIDTYKCICIIGNSATCTWGREVKKFLGG